MSSEQSSPKGLFMPRCVPLGAFGRYREAVERRFPGARLLIGETNPAALDAHPEQCEVIRIRGYAFTAQALKRKLNGLIRDGAIDGCAVPILSGREGAYDEILNFCAGAFPESTWAVYPDLRPVRLWFGDPPSRESAEQVVKSFLSSRRADELAMAARLIGEFRLREYIGELIRWLNDEDAALFIWSALALGQMRERRAVGPLLDIAMDASTDRADCAARALTRFGSAIAPQLAERLPQVDPEHHRFLLCAIDLIGGPLRRKLKMRAKEDPALAHHLERLNIPPAPAESPEISVVVCTHGRPESLARTLVSLRRQRLHLSRYEVIVVDNGPGAQRTETAVRSVSPAARFIALDEPNLSAARNAGVGLSTAPLIAFIDDDASAPPRYLQELLLAFERYPEALCVGGPAHPRSTIPLPRWLDDALRGYLTVFDYGIFPFHLDDVPGPFGVNFAFRREAFERFGLFRVDLGRQGGALLSGEDDDLVARLKTIARSCLYWPFAKVFHHIPPDRLTKSFMRRRAWWQGVSEARMGRRYTASALGSIARGGVDALIGVLTDVFSRVCRGVKYIGAGWDSLHGRST